MVRGDGEIDSMTQGLCERCGGTVDRAGDCPACMPVVTPVPDPMAAQPAITTAAEPRADTIAKASESERSEACRRFGWDPSMPDELPAPVAPQQEAPQTVVETVLPAPELEALFAALEASPIKIKPAAPEPVFEPIDDVAPAAHATADTPFDFSPAPLDPAPATETWTANTTPIALKPLVPAAPAIDVAAPPEIPEADHLSAAFNVQAAFSAASEPIAVTPVTPVEPVKLVELSDLIGELPATETEALPPAPPEAIVAEAPTASTSTLFASVAPEPIAAAPVTQAPTATAAPAAAAAARQPVRWRPLVTAVATVAILAAIGVPLSRLWLERTVAQPAVQQAAPPPAPAAQRPAATPAPASANVPAPARLAPPAPVLGAPAPPPVTRTAAVAPPRVASAERPRSTPLLSPDALVPPRPPRPAPAPAAPPQPAPSLSTLAPTTATPNASALPAPTAAAAPEPEPAVEAMPAPAAGPFFELNDVDSPPKVAARAEAALPAALEGQTFNEIVVVRVLVSQTGRPALVSLLRHSKAGLALDEAVIAAVKQWRFTPATKRGQSVSCFYHVAFPVRQ